MPAVSIILPTYERLAYLKEAVESVFNQTFADWELIVVDDGSTDGTALWLETIGDPRIITVARSHTGNKSILRNDGAARARAGWIAFLDSDDRWTPQKLARQMAFHRANVGLRWSYTGRMMIDAIGDPIPSVRFKAWEPHSGAIVRQVVTLEANIALPSVVVQRSLFDEAGGFNPSFEVGQDYELWLRLSERSDCGLLDEPLLQVRKHRAEGHKPPELSLAFSTMLDAFSARTTDAALRALSRMHSAYHAIDAADRFAVERRWPDARRALRMAMAIEPFSSFTYRAALRLGARRLRALGADFKG